MMRPMTIRKIAEIGHPVLREVARAVEPDELSSPEIQTFIDDLVETMRDANGAGLAATQIYTTLRICAVEVQNNPRYPYKPEIPLTVFVNPVITPLTEETFSNFEGCLSVPNLRGRVDRIARVKVSWLDRTGVAHEEEFTGFTAGTLQHEFDHLDGKLFVDKVEDKSTLCTWKEFDRHHKQSFLDGTVKEVVAKYHA